jgi:DNA-binding transcriptional LysR family regulator
MNLQQIKYFLAVVDCKNFSKAATRVCVAQPTLSAGIKALEEELGVSLFLRDNRRVLLTDAGKKVLPHARMAYQAFDAIRQTVVGEGVPILKLCMLNTAPVEPIAQLIRDYRDLFPSTIVELSEGYDQWVREQLMTGVVDAIITAEQQGDESASTLRLFEERVMLAAWEGHPLAARKEVSLIDLHQQPFIDRGGCELWSDLHSAMAAKNIVPKIVYRAEADEVVMELVAGGLGVSVLPRRQRSRAGVVFLPINDYSMTRQICLKWRIHDTSPRVECLKDFARNHPW